MIKNILPKSEFTRNVLTLMTGTTIAQAIPIAISPILTRLYTPEDFGVFALYIGIVSMIAIIVAARYEIAIVLPKSDKDAINILALSFLIILSMVIATFIIILLFKGQILMLLNANSIGNLIYLVPLSILLAGINQIFNYWSNRKEYFKNISNAQIMQSLGIGITQPALGYFSIYGGLIFGNITGRMISAFIFIDKFFKYDKEMLKSINRKDIINNMKIYKDFPLINSLHAFSDIIRTSGSVMLISSFFGTTILGFYSLSLRALQIPVGIVGSALGQVLYQKFSSLHNQKKSLYPYAKRVFIVLFIVSFIGFTILFFLAPSLFAFVFGEKWRVAGEYSQILIPYLFMNFIISPLSQIPIILNKQKEVFYISLVGNSIFILNILFFFNFDFKVMLKFLVISMNIYYIFIIIWFYRILNDN